MTTPNPLLQVRDLRVQVVAQRDVQRHDVLDLACMDGAIAVGSTRDGETVQKGGLALIGGAFEEIAPG